MTIAIVDVLKMIQIELDHRQRPSAALAVAGYRHRLFKQRPAIEQASQGIVPCLPLQRFAERSCCGPCGGSPAESNSIKVKRTHIRVRAMVMVPKFPRTPSRRVWIRSSTPSKLRSLAQLI